MRPCVSRDGRPREGCVAAAIPHRRCGVRRGAFVRYRRHTCRKPWSNSRSRYPTRRGKRADNAARRAAILLICEAGAYIGDPRKRRRLHRGGSCRCDFAPKLNRGGSAYYAAAARKRHSAERSARNDSERQPKTRRLHRLHKRRSRHKRNRCRPHSERAAKAPFR